MKKVLTLCILHKHPYILLGKKKLGMGIGRWNGFGGKIEEGETIEDAARREVHEEAGITVLRLEKCGILTFDLKGYPEMLEVHIFKADNFEGEPKESEEMSPRWFPVDEIPFENMWSDDVFWMPLLLGGKKFTGHFALGDNDEVLSYTLTEVETIPYD